MTSNYINNTKWIQYGDEEKEDIMNDREKHYYRLNREKFTKPYEEKKYTLVINKHYRITFNTIQERNKFMLEHKIKN